MRPNKVRKLDEWSRIKELPTPKERLLSSCYLIEKLDEEGLDPQFLRSIIIILLKKLKKLIFHF